MSQVDVQWPSEDEDFDATTDNVGSEPDFDEDDETDSASSPATTSEASVEPVEVQSEPAEEENKSQAEPEVEEPAPETKADDAEPASHDNSEPASTDEQAPDPAPEPEAPAEIPTAPEQPAPKPPKPLKIPKIKRESGFPGRAVIEIVLVAVVIGLGLWAWNLYTDNKDLKQQVSQLNNNPQVAVQKQTQSLIDNVSKLMQLPTGETPTVASVSDAAQAKQQSAFFNNAQNGDKVLMYVKAGEAILYRPSTNKIILVAPLTFTSNSSTGAASTTSTKTTAK